MSRRNKILHNLPDIDEPAAVNPDEKLYYQVEPAGDKYFHYPPPPMMPPPPSSTMQKPKEPQKESQKEPPILINIDKITSAIAKPTPTEPIVKLVSESGVKSDVKTDVASATKAPVAETALQQQDTKIIPEPVEKKSGGADDIESLNEEDLLYNLKIISELKKGDKLSYYDGKFFINDPGLVQGWHRWWYSQDRSTTIGDIKQLIDKTFAYIDSTFKKELTEGRYESYRNERVLYENNCQKLQKFREALLDTCRGLEKLKATYQDLQDRSMSSGIDLIVDRIKTRTDKINKIMKISV